MQFDGEGKEYLPQQQAHQKQEQEETEEEDPQPAPAKQAAPAQHAQKDSNLLDKDDLMGQNSYEMNSLVQKDRKGGKQTSSKKESGDPYSDIELNAANAIEVDKELASMQAEENDAFNTPLNSKEMRKMETQGRNLLQEITSGLKTYGKDKFWRKKNFFS
jgi:hypothetical protein